MKLNRTFIFLLFFIILFSQDFIFAEQLPFKKYTQASGLAGNYIFDLFQDRDGFLWIATDRGVSRFNGRAFKNFTKTDGLSVNHIYSIYQDRDGNMWFGTYEGGVIRYNHHTFKIITEADGLLNNTVFEIVQDKFGRMYFMTEHGLNVYRDSVLVSIKNRNHEAGNLVLHPSGKIFFSIDSRLFEIHPQQDIPLSPVEVYLTREQKSVLGVRSWASPIITKDNTILFPGRCSYLKIKLSDQAEIRHISIINKPVFALLEDHFGRLWYAERHDVKVAQAESVRSISKEIALEPDYIEALLEDFEGNIWLGTFGGGLYKYKGDHVQYFSEEDGLVSNMVNDVFEDSTGRIIVATNKGVSTIDSKNSIRTLNPETHNLRKKYMCRVKVVLMQLSIRL